MRQIVEILELILLVAFVCALAFIFEGDPDLWDKWHAHAMDQGCIELGKSASEVTK